MIGKMACFSSTPQFRPQAFLLCVHQVVVQYHIYPQLHLPHNCQLLNCLPPLGGSVTGTGGSTMNNDVGTEPLVALPRQPSSCTLPLRTPAAFVDGIARILKGWPGWRHWWPCLPIMTHSPLHPDLDTANLSTWRGWLQVLLPPASTSCAKPQSVRHQRGGLGRHGKRGWSVPQAETEHQKYTLNFLGHQGLV